MTGKIIKGICRIYYVNNGENKVYQCKAKGVFRNRKIKPLVGDSMWSFPCWMKRQWKEILMRSFQEE